MILSVLFAQLVVQFLPRLSIEVGSPTINKLSNSKAQYFACCKLSHSFLETTNLNTLFGFIIPSEMRYIYSNIFQKGQLSQLFFTPMEVFLNVPIRL